jgi:two-component system, cell cycle response regulator DivK
MSHNRPLVLVIEDNLDNRTLIKDMLDTVDYDAIEAANGEEGIAIATSKIPSLILLDLSLPRKDGWIIAREIKSNPITKHIPIIALTAHVMKGDRERALEAGCDDYVSKPIDIIDLIQKLKGHLSKVSGDEPGGKIS